MQCADTGNLFQSCSFTNTNDSAMEITQLQNMPRGNSSVIYHIYLRTSRQFWA